MANLANTRRNPGFPSQTWLIRYGGGVLLVLGVLVGVYGAATSQAGLVLLGVLVAIFGVLLPRLESALKASQENRDEANRIRGVDLERELVHQAEARFESADRDTIEQWAQGEVRRVVPDGVELVVDNPEDRSGKGDETQADLASPVRANLAATLLRQTDEAEVASADGAREANAAR